MVAYWTAYLKANYPVIYMNMMINCEKGMGDQEEGYNYKVARYVGEARARGVAIQPPCVLRSADDCSVLHKQFVPSGIRFGLSLIKGVTDKSVAWIRKHCREATSFKEFVLACYERCDVDDDAQWDVVSRRWDRRAPSTRLREAKAIPEGPAAEAIKPFMVALEQHDTAIKGWRKRLEDLNRQQQADPAAMEHAQQQLEAAQKHPGVTFSSLPTVVKEYLFSVTPRERRQYARVSTSDMQALIYAGAMDVFDPNRCRMLAMLEELCKQAGRWHKQTCRVEMGAKVSKGPDEAMEKINDLWYEDDEVPGQLGLEALLAHEREVTGCYLSSDPFAPFWKYKQDTPDLVFASDIPADREVDTLVMLERHRPTVVKRGRNAGSEMAFFTFIGEDNTDFEAVCFTDPWANISRHCELERGKIYVARVRRDSRRDGCILVNLQKLSETGNSV